MTQKAVVPAGSNWLEKDIREFRGSPAGRIGDEWMLITAGNITGDDTMGDDTTGNWNTMTASWGGLGKLWGRDAAFIFIRPSRYTRLFADAASLFTMSFFDVKYRKALALCGEKSGRDFDKAAEAGLTPIVFGNGKAAGAIGFREASEIIVCRKIYTHDFDPAQILDPAVKTACYPQDDYHRMYIGEVVALLTAEIAKPSEFR
jgi:flavin reductase (DIM6/NTAB) family NADH-FMN oxidoreductase RutF